MDEKILKLNFLALENQNFDFPVYCRRVENESQPKDKNPNIHRYNLPVPEDDNNYHLHDIVLSEKHANNEMRERIVNCSENNYLTKQYMLCCLIEECDKLNVKYIDKNKAIKINDVRIVTSEDKDGKEYLSVRPYFISSFCKFGYIVGHGFRCNEGVHRYSRNILIKTLFYNANGEYNANLQIDYYKKLTEGILENKRIFTFDINFDFERIPYARFSAQKFIFGNNIEHSSQFLGINKNGPYKPVKGNHKIYFIYKEEKKNMSHRLFHGLNGTYSQFPGLENFFGLKMKKENFAGISIDNYENGISVVIEKINEDNATHKIAILVLEKMEEEKYYWIKKRFLDAKISTQFILLETVQYENKLRWSVSNIALQCFAKIGGIPWKVKTENRDCLIIGISQSVDKDKKGNIKKYYGYSVMTDSSGIYKEVKFLHSGENEGEYLKGLLDAIRKIIVEKSQEYDKFILHITFKIRAHEIDEMVSSISSDKSVEIIAIRINPNSDIKLFSDSNSKKCEQGSYVKISADTYILCTEGLKEQNEDSKLRQPWPLELQFTYPKIKEGNISESEVKACIRDIYNLASANWRGFNSNKRPISLLYAGLISRYLKGLKKIGEEQSADNIDSSLPWFL